MKMVGHKTESVYRRYAIVERALKISDARQRSFRALLLQLHGEMAARRDPQEAERAEDSYREALALATELGMRPLQAHCHLGFGELCAQKRPAGAGPWPPIGRRRPLPLWR